MNLLGLISNVFLILLKDKEIVKLCEMIKFS